MKLLALILLTFSLVSCASYREPSSTEEDHRDVSRGINTDSYGTR